MSYRENPLITYSIAIISNRWSTDTERYALLIIIKIAVLTITPEDRIQNIKTLLIFLNLEVLFLAQLYCSLLI